MIDMLKPKISTRCPANQYAGPDERIIEFSFPNGEGGLISFKMGDHPIVDVYNCDQTVEVRHREVQTCSK